MRLTVDNERIDAASDIVNRRIAGETQTAALRVDFNFANGAAIRKHGIMHLVVGDNRKSRREILRHFMACHFLREFKKVEAAIAFPCRKTSVAEVDAVRRRVQDYRGGALALVDQLAG